MLNYLYITRRGGNAMNECKCKPCKVKEFFVRDHTTVEKGLIVGAALLTGIVVGFAISPIRRVVTIVEECE